MKTVLSIAGSDSGGGAGIQQDLKVFSAFGLHGASAITAVTAQNTLGVQKVFALPADIIEAQIDSVMSDLSPAAVKTGMLANSRVIELVCRKMLEHKVKNLVVDPVMVATSGHRLLDEEAISAMKKLISAAALSTPNLHEARILSGLKIKNEADMVAAAKSIGDCVVKGGHLNAVDILCYKGNIYRFPSKEKKDFSIHGTGCAFSAAVSCGLALGLEVPAAVASAKEFMDDVISRSFSPGAGLRLADTGGIMLSESYEGAARKKLAGELETAVAAFLAYERAYLLVPQVGSNVAMALPGASSLSDVAGVSGRLVRCEKRVVPVGTIRFGGSSHVGRVVLTAMKFDPKKRAAMNIRFSEEIVSACKKLGLSVASFDRRKQPADTLLVESGTAEAIKAAGKVPDIIYDRGGIGKEAMVRIIGEDAVYVVKKTKRIGDMLSP
jgi:hydroxymethylpyrimidine/phosphomethylpyrimidine kinase